MKLHPKKGKFSTDFQFILHIFGYAYATCVTQLTDACVSVVCQFGCIQFPKTYEIFLLLHVFRNTKPTPSLTTLLRQVDTFVGR